MIESRIAPQGRTTIPAPVRQALDLRPGDRLAWRIEPGQAVLTRAAPALDPFAVFTEWAGEADQAGYADF